MQAIDDEIDSDPDSVNHAPHTLPNTRLDEATAASKKATGVEVVARLEAELRCLEPTKFLSGIFLARSVLYAVNLRGVTIDSIDR